MVKKEFRWTEVRNKYRTSRTRHHRKDSTATIPETNENNRWFQEQLTIVFLIQQVA
jgi:hypothetical protein